MGEKDSAVDKSLVSDTLFTESLAVSAAQSVSSSIFDIRPYRTVEEFNAELKRLAALDSKRVVLSTYGTSFDGKALYSITLNPSESHDEDLPEVLVTSLIHGVEFIAGELCLSLIQRLIEDENSIPWLGALRKQARFVFTPMLNPDAYDKNIKRMAMRKLAATRKNANKTDLNRNFPYKEGLKLRHPASGSSRFTWHPSYLGSFPLSEPETKALAALVESHQFKVSWSYHSFSGLVLYPRGYTKHKTPDHHKFLEIAQTFVDAQPHVPYKILQCSSLYPTKGGLDDWLYDRFGILPLTLEVSQPRDMLPLRWMNPFCWMNPVNKAYWIENDRDASLKGIAKGLELAIA